MKKRNLMAEIIVALDGLTGESALRLTRGLGPSLSWVKVGLELYTREGPSIVRSLKEQGYRVFLDLKFHDIPATVFGAVRAAGETGADLINVHAAGGEAMMRRAHEAKPPEARVLAVTVLTSEPAGGRLVVERALLARECGLDGVVCAAAEAADVKRACGVDFLCVTPGIRPAGGARDDQARVSTPAAAAAGGSDLLVVGRAITRADDPRAALESMQEEIREV
ncbi:MAG: orotidine-5'-phosphate decarboxylase [Gemmatimonadetes bacterium]|nr:orotidine-5'-phosphate decarboxylase [Gemmatimonadota bacterium]